MEKVEDNRGTLREALAADLKPKSKEKVKIVDPSSQEMSDNDEQLRRITGRKS